MIRRPRADEPLPAATAVVLAVLVALSATIAHGVGERIDPYGETTSSRVPASLATSGRVLASALASVAERLENDWTASGRRLKPSAPRSLDLPCLALDRAGSDSMAVGVARRWQRQDGDERLLEPCVRERLIRLATSLPPPARA